MKSFDEFKLAQQEFLKVIPTQETEVVTKIKEIINLAGQHIKEWPIEKLATVEERLARYSETLGEMYANWDTQAEWTKAWINDQVARCWNEEKENIKQLQGKTTQGEIERNIRTKLWADQANMIMMAGQAKVYKAMISAIDRVLLALTHRIRSLEREYKNTPRGQ